jgi:endogenous inhibitor of DNA gyrase (YacG/DUF329 family)
MNILLKSLGRKPRKGKVFKCPVCGEYFYRNPSKISYRNLKNRYCSRICFSKSLLKGKDLVCKNCGKKYHRPLSQIKLRGSSFCSKKCQGEMLSKDQKGKNNLKWKGGISPKNRRLRSSKKWRLWREAVFKRDNYTCQECGARSKSGKTIILHPHHIKSFSKYPKLRFVVSNGLTVCEKCHRKLHKKINDKIRKKLH